MSGKVWQRRRSVWSRQSVGMEATRLFLAAGSSKSFGDGGFSCVTMRVDKNLILRLRFHGTRDIQLSLYERSRSNNTMGQPPAIS